MANVGKNIKKLRMNCKMTQDTLAEQLFVSRQTVSNYENGKSNPDIDMLIKMAEIFGTDVNALIYGPPVPVKKLKIKKNKREYIKFGIITALLILTGIGMAAFEKTGMAEWFYYRFISWPAMVLYMLVKPFLCLGLGWAVMQAAWLFLDMKRPKVLQNKAAGICRWILIGFGIIYLILVLLPIIEDGIHHWQLWQAEQQGLNYSYEGKSIFPWMYSRFFTMLWYKFFYINKGYSALYFLPGIFLWASASEKENVAEKSADNIEKQNI